jgi:hypothetical protein
LALKVAGAIDRELLLFLRPFFLPFFFDCWAETEDAGTDTEPPPSIWAEEEDDDEGRRGTTFSE